jgi:hypothetical protein
MRKRAPAGHPDPAHRDRRAEPRGAFHPRHLLRGRAADPRKIESIIVPAEAVIFSRNGLSVAIVENGSVHLRELTVALPERPVRAPAWKAGAYGQVVSPWRGPRCVDRSPGSSCIPGESRHVEPPYLRAAQPVIVEDHSMSRPVAKRRFQRSTTSSASRRAARSAFSLAAPALMSSPLVRAPIDFALVRRVG